MPNSGNHCRIEAIDLSVGLRVIICSIYHFEAELSVHCAEELGRELALLSRKLVDSVQKIATQCSRKSF